MTMTRTRLSAIALAVWVSFWMSGGASANVLIVDEFDFSPELHADESDESSASLIAHTHVDSTTFNAMSLAALDAFDAIYLNDTHVDFVDLSNPNLAALVGTFNTPGAGRLYLSTHDAFGHSTPGALSLIRNSVAWAAAASAAETNATGLVVFWENDVEIPSILPVEWALALEDHSGDEVDILAGFDGIHPIYAGDFGPVTDEFDCATDTTLNWCNGHHSDFTSFNAAILTASELDTETDDWTGLVRDPGASQQDQDQGVVPEPASIVLFMLGGLGAGLGRRRLLGNV